MKLEIKEKKVVKISSIEVDYDAFCKMLEENHPYLSEYRKERLFKNLELSSLIVLKSLKYDNDLCKIENAYYNYGRRTLVIEISEEKEVNCVVCNFDI